MKKYSRSAWDPLGRLPRTAVLNSRRCASAIVLIYVAAIATSSCSRGSATGGGVLSDPANGARTEQVGAFAAQWTGVSFLILADVESAQDSFNSNQKWASAPRPPLDLTRFAVDLSTLAQPSMLDLSKF